MMQGYNKREAGGINSADPLQTKAKTAQALKLSYVIIAHNIARIFPLEKVTEVKSQ